MIVSIHPPQFMPWLGYFDKMDQADHFILLDSVPFKKNEWQNRNRIKTAQGAQWLTVPVSYDFPARIDEVLANGSVNWPHKHWQYGCAGTLIRHVLRGDNVFIMIITDGAQGGDPAARREEQLAAGKIIGAQEVFFGDYPDTRSPRVGHKANPSRFGVHSLW